VLGFGAKVADFKANIDNKQLKKYEYLLLALIMLYNSCTFLSFVLLSPGHVTFGTLFLG
jgi:hypothetical protein